jgi:hypothetical protein
MPGFDLLGKRQRRKVMPFSGSVIVVLLSHFKHMDRPTSPCQLFLYTTRISLMTRRPHTSLQHIRSERVILRRDLFDEVVAHDRKFDHDVFPDLRYLGEEEEGKDAGSTAEACCYAATVGRIGVGSAI